MCLAIGSLTAILFAKLSGRVLVEDLNILSRSCLAIQSLSTLLVESLVTDVHDRLR
jgi:hypothetical protein